VVAGNVQVGGAVAGTEASFTGTVAGATPVASNHLATKDYVDAATAGAAGGGSGSAAICGNTRQKYNGNLGGLAGADAKCEADFGSGWRFATTGNWAAAARSFAVSVGWVHQFDASVTCNSWTSSNSADTGPLMNVQEVSGKGQLWAPTQWACNTELPLICCNF